MNNYLLNPSCVVSNILEQAEVVIKKQGMCSFKLVTIADLAGCSTKTLYNYFHNKEDIVTALFIRHINMLQQKVRLISSSEALSNKEKIIYTSMLDPMRCLTAEKGDLCLNFTAANPQIHQFASPEFIGNMQAVFFAMKENNEAMWRQAIDDGDLQSNKEDIVECMFMLMTLQRGAVVMGQNKFLRQFGYDNDARPTFNAICRQVNLLRWKEKCPALSYPNMLKTIFPLLDTNNTNQQHFDLLFESLKYPIEL
ncbi:TetR/AcrR family transcriptional regulator [Shewanella youngdeokensis]|uniref:TetR/AcrR family transcriptional regulator n=1 Tax=Shewanella youngdeokensis TaxID=2999068 RepID=A0ABZ0JXW9_9GAMM|nr:TetR/AcrR family transcriptional regulator [Shewanella sp. DAU334]